MSSHFSGVESRDLVSWLLLPFNPFLLQLSCLWSSVVELFTPEKAGSLLLADAGPWSPLCLPHCPLPQQSLPFDSLFPSTSQALLWGMWSFHLALFPGSGTGKKQLSNA